MGRLWGHQFWRLTSESDPIAISRIEIRSSGKRVSCAHMSGENLTNSTASVLQAIPPVRWHLVYGRLLSFRTTLSHAMSQSPNLTTSL